MDFLPYPYMDSPPPPASSSLLRLVQSPGARRMLQWFQHHGQTVHAYCLWSPFSPRVAGTAGRSTQPFWVRGGPKEAHGKVLLVFLSCLISPPSICPCLWGYKAHCPDLLFPQTAA